MITPCSCGCRWVYCSDCDTTYPPTSSHAAAALHVSETDLLGRPRKSQWTLEFGNGDGITPGEYYCFIRDLDGSMVDTFYGTAVDVFEQVQSLLRSHATGTRL